MRKRERTDIKIKQRGFTLIELLAVVIIISALFLIALPRFDNIANRSALDAATSSVVSALTLARQHALTHRQPTYLLIPDDDADAAHAFQRFTIYSIKLNTSAQPINPDDGEFIIGWSDLPEGILFDNTDARGANILVTANDSVFTGGFDDDSQIQIAGTNYYACGFTPTGQRKADDAFLYLAEGFYRSSGVFQPTTLSKGTYQSMLIHLFSSGTINVASEKAMVP